MKNKKTESDDDSKLHSDALSHIQVFNDENLTYGIPTKLFLFGIVMSVGLSFVLKWYWGLLFAPPYFLFMSDIHKDDPRAFDGWRDVITRRHQDRWITAVKKPRKIRYF